MRIQIPAVTLLAAVAVLAQAQDKPSSKQQSPAPAKSAAAKKATPTAATKAKASSTGATTMTLKTDKEKFSYALGMNLGGGLHQQGLDVDPNIVALGMKAALSGGKTLLTLEEMRAALMQARAAIQKKELEAQKAVTTANEKEGEAYLAANKSKEGVVTLPSGMQYKILKEGTGPKPAAADSVVCNYRGTLLDGSEFDSSYKRGQPATFPVSGVIKGWTEALQLMPVGSKWQLFIPSSLAYGDQGTPDGSIGPGSTLIFEVELLSIEEKPKSEAAPQTEEKK